VLIDPAGVIVELAHGVVLPELGMVISGLMPALSISVAPSGMVPPLSVKLEVDPGVDSGDAVPLGDSAWVEVQLDVELADPGANPPPSKLELVPADVVVPEPLVPDRPE
jgi:hypothetical protein